MDAIERIEVDFKTTFVNVLTLKTGDPFAHFNEVNFPNFPIVKKSKKGDKIYKFSETKIRIKNEVDGSCEEFVAQHRNKYSGIMPFGKTCEVISFGVISVLFEGLDKYTKKEIANRYKMPANILEDAIKHLCYLRNLCAHHSRVWNRNMAIKYTLPNKKNNPVFHNPISIPNQKIFGSMSLLKHFMDIIAPQSRWTKSFIDLIEEHPNIPLSAMQMPENWREYELWSHKFENSILTKPI